MTQKRVEEFVLDFSSQREWGWLIVTAFFLAGVGAGTFLLSMLLERVANLDPRGPATLGLLIVALGASGAFILDLGRATRFWRAMVNPLSSWISRGVVSILAFGLFGALVLASYWFDGLPWSGTALAQTFYVLALLAAFSVMIYSGFVLCYSTAIAFWNTTLLPVLFILYALMGGLAVIFVTLPGQASSNPPLRFLETIEIWLIISAFVLLAIYLLPMARSTSGARRAVHTLLRGNLVLPFLGGVVGLGLVLPLAITLYTFQAGLSLFAASTALAAAGFLELFGGFLFRYTFIRAGMYSPLL